jgi:hypothetical protein
MDSSTSTSTTSTKFIGFKLKGVCEHICITIKCWDYVGLAMNLTYVLVVTDICVMDS